MTLDLVLDIGNSRVKGGFFEGKQLVDFFSFASDLQSTQGWAAYLEKRPTRNLLLSSTNTQAEKTIKDILNKKNIPFSVFDHSNLKLIIDVDEPQLLKGDRIANAYGALFHFPINDCIVIDIGASMTIDFIAKEGHYLGGVIHPGPELCIKALTETIDKPFHAFFNKPDSALAKTSQASLQSGIYYGLLGAIERMIAELKLCALSPSSIKVITTGGALNNETFSEDLKELTDFNDPYLTLRGLREILEETMTNN